VSRAAFTLPGLLKFTAERLPEEPGDGTPGACIGTVRVVLDVVRHFGFVVHEVPVECVAVNRVYRQMVDENEGEIPADLDVLMEWKERGAHKIVVDPTEADDEHGWNGHLVIYADPKPGWHTGMMVDVSSDQFTRREKGMDVPGFVVAEAPPVFRAGKMQLRVDLDDGTVIIYKASPDNTRYLDYNDWKRKHRTGPIVGPIIRAAEEKLKGHKG